MDGQDLIPYRGGLPVSVPLAARGSPHPAPSVPTHVRPVRRDELTVKSSSPLGNPLNPAQRKTWLELNFVDASKKTIKKPQELERDLLNPPGRVDDQLFDRIAGSIIGMTIGDALGAHVEFRPREYLLEHPVTDLSSGGTWGLAKGQFTDDTSMALCLANSLIACQGFNLYDQLVRYKWWYRHGYMSSTGVCFDIGNATREAIEMFESRQEQFARKHHLDHTRLDSLRDTNLLKQFDVKCSEDGVAGNGALMRLAPVPLFFFRDPATAVEYSGQSGQITHGDLKAFDACRYYGALIVAAMKGDKKEQLLDKKFYESHRPWFGKKDLHPDILEIARGSYEKRRGYDDGIRGGGYIVKALEAALWAFWSTNSFEEGALAAVNLGDDTDTTAAIYGQLAGCFYGLKKLPKEWVASVYARTYLMTTSAWLAYEGEQCFQKMRVSGTLIPAGEDRKAEEGATAVLDGPDDRIVDIVEIKTLARGEDISCEKWISWSPEDIFAWLKSIRIRDEKCLQILQEKQITTPQFLQVVLSSRQAELGITNDRDQRLVWDKLMKLKEKWANDFYRKLKEDHCLSPKALPPSPTSPNFRPLHRQDCRADKKIHRLIAEWVGLLPEKVEASDIQLIYNAERTDSFYGQIDKAEERAQRLGRVIVPMEHLHPSEKQIVFDRLRGLGEKVKHRRSVKIVRGWQRISEEKLTNVPLHEGRSFASSALAAIGGDGVAEIGTCLLMSYIIVSNPKPFSLYNSGHRFRFICDRQHLTPQLEPSYIPPRPSAGTYYFPTWLDGLNSMGVNDELVVMNDNQILDYAVVNLKRSGRS